MLSRHDSERLLGFVAEAETITGDQPFTGELLVELGRLIEADWVTYTEVDPVHRRSLMYLPRPGDEDDEGGDIGDEGWELMGEHPICKQWRRDGRSSALRLSDVTTPREWRQSRIYDEFFRPWGIEYELKARLPSPPWHFKTFLFNRMVGQDFTNRDRLVLDMLQPHLMRLWQAARTRRLLAAALAELGRTPAEDHHGVVFLGAADEIEFASAPARRLLHDFFPREPRERLPRALVKWLDTDDGPLVRVRGSRRLTIERTADAIVLEESQMEVALTVREREVLSWVARGKTNAETAELLWLAPSTVRKHLENIYAKLGVTTRTAAAARFLGLIEHRRGQQQQRRPGDASPEEAAPGGGVSQAS